MMAFDAKPTKSKKQLKKENQAFPSLLDEKDQFQTDMEKAIAESKEEQKVTLMKDPQTRGESSVTFPSSDSAMIDQPKKQGGGKKGKKNKQQAETLKVGFF